MINADVVDNPLFAFEHERKFWNYKTFPILATIWLECYVLFLLDIVTCSIGLDIENANLKWMIQSVNCWLLHSNHCFQAANCWLEHHNCWLERCSKLWQHLNWRERNAVKNLANWIWRPHYSGEACCFDSKLKMSHWKKSMCLLLAFNMESYS